MRRRRTLDEMRNSIFPAGCAIFPSRADRPAAKMPPSSVRWKRASTSVLLALVLSVVNPIATPAQTSAPPSIVLSSPVDYQVFQRTEPTGGRIVVETSLESPSRNALLKLRGLEARLTGKSPRGELWAAW